MQEIPLYGQQSDTAETWARREDPRDKKDVEHGRVFTRSTGALIYPTILSHFLNDRLSVFSRRVKERRQKEMGTMLMTSRAISVAMRAERPRQSERLLNSQTRSTQRLSSKKRTLCSCGLGYSLIHVPLHFASPITYSDFGTSFFHFRRQTLCCRTK